MAAIRSVLLDRDGTLIEDKHYLSDPEGVELIPGAAKSLLRLHEEGLSLFVVTNQSGIGRGYFSEKDYHTCHLALTELLRKEKVQLSGSVFCPHAPEENCFCRKPSLGMWEQLAQSYSLHSEHTVMVGDKQEDILFGKAAGLPLVILVLTGKGLDAAKKMGLTLPDANSPYSLIPARKETFSKTLPHAVAHNIEGATRCILDYIRQA